VAQRPVILIYMHRFVQLDPIPISNLPVVCDSGQLHGRTRRTNVTREALTHPRGVQAADAVVAASPLLGPPSRNATQFPYGFRRLHLYLNSVGGSRPSSNSRFPNLSHRLHLSTVLSVAVATATVPVVPDLTLVALGRYFVTVGYAYESSIKAAQWMSL
jgi:hypothetical protein